MQLTAWLATPPALHFKEVAFDIMLRPVYCPSTIEHYRPATVMNYARQTMAGSV